VVAIILKGVYNAKDRCVIIKKNQEACEKADKKKRTAILNELSKILHLNKQCLGCLLRSCGKVVIRKGNIVIVADPAINAHVLYWHH